MGFFEKFKKYLRKVVKGRNSGISALLILHENYAVTVKKASQLKMHFVLHCDVFRCVM